MKNSKVFVKRSNSPQQPPKTIEISDRKKKSTSNTQLASNPYKKTINQFDSYGKTQKKRNSYLKQLLKNNGESTNKYRIVTQPVEERLLYLGNNNFGYQAGSAIKMPNNSRTKLQSNLHREYGQNYLKLNIRTQKNSKQKLKTGQSFHRKNVDGCRNCEKYKQQFEYMKKEMHKICMDKIFWKSGQMHINDVKQSFFNLKGNQKWKSPHKQIDEKMTEKIVDKELLEIKKHIFDLMRDIDSLSAIDYPKLLSLNIFKFDPFYTETPSSQEQQLKKLLGQLRNSMQGKINAEQLFDVCEYNSSEHSKMIFRNLKNRLGHYMRENLELKMKKEILERSEEITKESEEYLKKVIESVLLSYAEELNGLCLEQ